MGVGTKQPGGGNGNSGSSDVFTSDFQVILDNGKTFGKYLNGQTVPANGKKASEVIIMAAQEFLNPVFSSFLINGQTSPVEVGTIISGNKTFNWGTTNAPNVQAGSIVIRDQTANTNLASGLANDGTEIVAVGSVTKLTPSTNIWRIQGTNTQSVAMTPRDYAVDWRYKYFAGVSNTAITNSAEARALPQGALHNGGFSFILNTGNTYSDFYIAVHNSLSVTQVLDLDALSANITNQYVLTGTITVQDAGGNNLTYKLYHMHNAVPYSDFPNHRHSVTTA